MPLSSKAIWDIPWKEREERNPNIKGNESRNRFAWNPVSELGHFFEIKVKGNVFNAIKKARKQIGTITLEGDYNTLHGALIASIKKNINKEFGRIYPFMFDLSDILIYYIQNPDDIYKLKKSIPIRASIEIAHKGCLIYDKTAYVYEDNRLQEISGVLKNEVCVYWKDDPFLQKMVDVTCFIMKEDIRWRRILIKILQDIQPVVFEIAKRDRSILLVGLCRLCETVKDFQLTEAEIVNAGWDAWIS